MILYFKFLSVDTVAIVLNVVTIALLFSCLYTARKIYEELTEE